MPFTFHPTEIPEVIRVETKSFPDQRGWFFEVYKSSEFRQQGIRETFVQDACSCSVRGVLRGLHFQKSPRSQGKLVFAIHGEIFDVVVDIRRGSPTYRQWVACVLSDQNREGLYIPAGFAHGFCVLSESATVLYKVTAEYSPAHDRGIIWNDPSIGIRWPITQPILSPKDQALPLLANAEPDLAGPETRPG